MRVLVAKAVALLVMMMSQSCVANPAKEMQFELEDDEGFDLINLALNQDENESVDQLTKVEAEDADGSTFLPTFFATKCHSVNKYTGECVSDVVFTAMAKTYKMKVKVQTRYTVSTNRLTFLLFINARCIAAKYGSAADDSLQEKTVEYRVNGTLFEFVIKANHMFSDTTHSGTRSCSWVVVKADNKVWATTQQGCVTLH